MPETLFIYYNYMTHFYVTALTAWCASHSYVIVPSDILCAEITSFTHIINTPPHLYTTHYLLLFITIKIKQMYVENQFWYRRRVGNYTSNIKNQISAIISKTFTCAHVMSVRMRNSASRMCDVFKHIKRLLINTFDWCVHTFIFHPKRKI